MQNIKQLVKDNSYFRKVLVTGAHSQVVAMCIPVGEDIGEEIHETVDQTFFFLEGECLAIINNQETKMDEEDVAFVPAGIKHNFRNIGQKSLKLVTVYSPPQHIDGLIHKTKKDAEEEEYG